MTPTRHNANPSGRTVLAFLIVGLVVGMIISPSLVRQMRDGVFTRWEPLGMPPEPITRLLGYEFGDRARILVRVETISGALYQCCSRQNTDWNEVTPSDLVYADACSKLPSQAAVPPREVLSCVESRAFEGATDRTQFALLDDGSIWVWRHRVEFLPELPIICWSGTIGLLLGIGVMGGVWIIQRRRTPIRQTHPTK
jgi:hypothetical protein